MHRYAPYSHYSPDGLPVGWQKKRLRFAVRLNPSKSEIRLKENDHVSFVPMDAIGENGGIRLTEEKELGEIGGGYTYFCNDDVVIAKITPCFENGKGALAKGLKNETAFGTTELHVLRVDRAQLEPGFVFYLTISDLFRKLGESEMYGAGGQKRVPESFFKDFPTGLPSLTEQKIIISFLDHKTAQIDALIDKKQTLLEKLAEKRSVLVSHAVTKGLAPSVPMKDSGVAWLGEMPAHWKKGVKLNYMAAPRKNTFVNGPFGSDLLSSELTDSGIPVIYSGDVKAGVFYRKSSSYVTEEKAKQLDFCRVDPGDLLLAKVGDPPGDAAIYPDDAPSGIVTQDVVRIKLNINFADTEYVCFLLNSKYGRQIVQAVSVEATRGRFSLGDFKALRFVMPPLTEQRSIAQELVRLVAPISSQELKILEVISKLQEYRLALITNAVTGKIDVRLFGLRHTSEKEALHE